MIKSIFYNRIFIVLCVVMLIYTSGYALSTVFTFGIYIEALFAYLFLFPIMLVHFKKKVNILTTSFILLFVMVVSTFITSGLTSATAYLSIIFKIIIAFGVVTLYDFHDFARYYLKIMKFVATTSLIGHYLINYSNYALDLPIVTNINSVPYGVGYLFFYIPWIPERNCGIFWEPGLFATFLIIAIIFEFFYKKNKRSFLNIFLFIAAILTTRSSAGYGLLLLILFLVILKSLYFVKDVRMRKVSMFLVFVSSVIILLNYNYVIEFLNLSDNDVIFKLASEQLATQSRILAINHNLATFLNNPFFGVGISQAYRNVRHVADTSTSTFMLGVFGFMGFQYTFYWVYGILKNRNNDIYVNIMILLIFLFVINKEPHQGIVFSWCILFYFLKNSSNKSKDVLPNKSKTAQ